MAKKNLPPIYDHEDLRNEREFGFFWYSGIWRILRPVLIGCTALLLVFGLLSTGYRIIDEKFLSPVDPQSATLVPFTIQSGASLTRVSNNLEEQGLIKNRSVFKYYCDFIGIGQKIQAGDYQLSRDMDIFEIAQQLTMGDGKPITAMMTVIPGWTIVDVANKLKEEGLISDVEAFLLQCRTGEGLTDYYFIQEALKTDRAGERKFLLEGYLAPNTYEVYTSATPTELLKKLLDQTDKVFIYEWQERATSLSLSFDEILTLASLIEKEAKTSDFAKVSAVFHNRLKIDMKLGSDVTIHYISGERRMSLRNSDMAVESPYNTYLYTGLPLGPICNPSPEAIRAALYPDEAFLLENYLYFCSKNPESGELHFSKTLDEHEQAVAIYAPLWKAYDEQRGL